MKGWISAAIRKPREGYYVLCTDNSNIWIGYYIKRNNRVADDRDGWHEQVESFCKDKITYWQNLPKLPK
jgi:hypothetical protein